MQDTYSEAELDGMSLSQRVELAVKGKIDWKEVNRPEADERRRAQAEAAIPLSTRLKRTPLCRSQAEYERRRYLRIHNPREELAAVERRLRLSVEQDKLRKAERAAKDWVAA